MFIKNKWKSILTLVIALAITMTAGYIYGFYQGSTDNEDGREIEKDVSKLAVVEKENYRDEEGVDKILASTEIIFNKFYMRCKDVVSEKRKPYKEEIGVKGKAIQSLFSGWTIEEFTGEQLVLSKQIDNYCSNHYILKEQGGLVTIYVPVEEDQGLKVIKHTPVKVDSLPPALQQEIEKGMAVESLEQVEYMIESWQS